MFGVWPRCGSVDLLDVADAVGSVALETTAGATTAAAMELSASLRFINYASVADSVLAGAADVPLRKTRVWSNPDRLPITCEVMFTSRGI